MCPLDNFESLSGNRTETRRGDVVPLHLLKIRVHFDQLSLLFCHLFCQHVYMLILYQYIQFLPFQAQDLCEVHNVLFCHLFDLSLDVVRLGG